MDIFCRTQWDSRHCQIDCHLQAQTSFLCWIPLHWLFHHLLLNWKIRYKIAAFSSILYIHMLTRSGHQVIQVSFNTDAGIMYCTANGQAFVYRNYNNYGTAHMHLFYMQIATIQCSKWKGRLHVYFICSYCSSMLIIKHNVNVLRTFIINV